MKRTQNSPSQPEPAPAGPPPSQPSEASQFPTFCTPVGGRSHRAGQASSLSPVTITRPLAQLSWLANHWNASKPVSKQLLPGASYPCAPLPGPSLKTPGPPPSSNEQINKPLSPQGTSILGAQCFLLGSAEVPCPSMVSEVRDPRGWPRYPHCPSLGHPTLR